MNTFNSPKEANQKNIENKELEEPPVRAIVQTIEYEHNSILSKSIIKLPTGSITAMSFDEGMGLDENTSPFETFIQIIDGTADIIVDCKSNVLKAGDWIIIPKHIPSLIKPQGRFKLLTTIIKSGYE